MELKEYQKRVIKRVDGYLKELTAAQAAAEAIQAAAGSLPPEVVKMMAASMDAPLIAWEKLGLPREKYTSKKDGLGHSIPHFCLKVPTGGGKTLLAIESIGSAIDHWKKTPHGLVVWFVPTNQIYRQTLRALQDKAHPYRQRLDNISNDRTLVIEKTNAVSKQELQENLTILLLMLPSANRKERETLKMFQDSGVYGGVFPADDDYLAHRELVKTTPNLDVLGEAGDIFGRVTVKSSLGNLVRLMRPIFILDEGQKAASENAQATLRDFNPSLLIELSATPPAGANLLVDVRGRELEREGMLKLDLHLINEGHAKWQSTLAHAKKHRDFLEDQARAYEARTGIYIRPIQLIQVERTGKEQRDSSFIHAADAFEYLTGVLGVPPDQVAIKSSSQDDLADVDDVGGLMSKDCPYRYIITKQALQEGWDCPFAYVLAILGNPKSATALTQLVGRVLRQPFGRKSKNQYLDESYVFCFQRDAKKLLGEVKRGFELEGLGDLAATVSSGASLKPTQTQVDQPRSDFQKRRVALPVFAVKSGGAWRQASYDMDIARRVDWSRVDLAPIEEMKLADAAQSFELSVDLGQSDGDEVVKLAARKSLQGKLEDGDALYFAKHLMEVVPNPWRAYDFADRILRTLSAAHGPERVGDNFMRVVEFAQTELQRQRDVLGKEIFEKMLRDKEMVFQVLVRNGAASWSIPRAQTRPTNAKRLTRHDGGQLQRSLFEFVDEELADSDLEMDVACFLDEQEKLLFWYRSVPRRDYFIQGWQPNRIWPDFIASTKTASGIEGLVIESKGEHLEGNKDTKYKEEVFQMCSLHFVASPIGDGAAPKIEIPEKVQFKVVGEKTWQQELLGIFGQPAASKKGRKRKVT